MTGGAWHFNDSHDGGRLAGEVDDYIMLILREREPEREPALRVIAAAAALDPEHCPTCRQLVDLATIGQAAASGQGTREELAVLSAANRIAEGLNPWISR